MSRSRFFRTVVSVITVLSLVVLLGCDMPNDSKDSTGAKLLSGKTNEMSIFSLSTKTTKKKTTKKKATKKKKAIKPTPKPTSKPKATPKPTVTPTPTVVVPHPVNPSELTSLFDGISLTKSFKTLGNNNPLMTQRFTADPWAMEYNGRLYVYTTNDIVIKDASGKIQNNNYGPISTLNCFSSADLVNWTDHGTIEVKKSNGGATSWANNSWAPAAAHKTINGKEKFFIYFADSARGIGVLESDSPVGPFKDPIDKPLITKSTPNCQDIVWLFDPAVLVDTDGKAYLYFGGGVPTGKDAMPLTSRVIQLGDDMISTVGEAKTIEAPYIFEDSGINKIGDTYYYSYCSNWSSKDKDKNNFKSGGAEIVYMTSSSPMGPFKYVGSVLKNPAAYFGTAWNNNHHAMVSFKNKMYILYHSQVLQNAMGFPDNTNYRCTQMDEVKVNADGTIALVNATKTGVAQISNFDPYKTTEAETIANSAGVTTKAINESSSTYGSVNMAVTDISKGDWLGVTGVDFGTTGAKTFTAKVASKIDGNAIKICLDSATGPVVGYLGVPNTGSDDKYTEATATITGATGKHDLYFVFAGDGFQFDSWSFK